MSQSAQSQPDGSGATVRAGFNTILAALFSTSSGSSAPSATADHQLWANTGSNLLQRRNAANTGWLTICSLDESFALSRSSNTILGVSDVGKTILATSTWTQTFTANATLGDGWFVFFYNTGTGNITLDPNSSETIDGATTIILGPGEGCRIASNGTSFFTSGRRTIAGPLTSVASGTTTSLAGNGSNNLLITGTTTITSFGNSGYANSPLYQVKFSGILTLTESGSLLTPTTGNIITAAGDYAIVLDLGSNNWQIVNYYRASGQALVFQGPVSTIASGTTTDLGTAVTNNVNVTGTTTITSLGSSASTANPYYFVTFGGILTLTYNATSLQIPGAANQVTAAGDFAICKYLGSGNWQVVMYFPAAGIPSTLTLLATTTISSSTASVSFTSGITSAYSKYILEVIDLIPASSGNTDLLLTIQQGGSFSSGNYNNWHTLAYSTGTAQAPNGGSSSAAFNLTAGNGGIGGGVQNGMRMQATVQVINPSTSTPLQISYNSLCSFTDNSSAFETVSKYGSGINTAAAATTGFKFAMSSGNISSGIFRLYGVI